MWRLDILTQVLIVAHWQWHVFPSNETTCFWNNHTLHSITKLKFEHTHSRLLHWFQETVPACQVPHIFFQSSTLWQCFRTMTCAQCRSHEINWNQKQLLNSARCQLFWTGQVWNGCKYKYLYQTAETCGQSRSIVYVVFRYSSLHPPQQLAKDEFSYDCFFAGNPVWN